jgi:AcrR family transcriptional regulator
MSKSPAGTERTLIETAKRLIPRYGVSKLSIRELASKAHVNLGLFHYHFKTKEHFFSLVLQEIYEEFFEDFSVEIAQGKNRREQLQLAIENFARFTKKHRGLFFALIRDAINDEPCVLNFAKKNFARHGLILMDLVGSSKKNGKGKELDRIQTLVFLMAAINGPLFAPEAVKRVFPGLGVFLRLWGCEESLESEKFLKMRIELLMDALFE